MRFSDCRKNEPNCNDKNNAKHESNADRHSNDIPTLDAVTVSASLTEKEFHPNDFRHGDRKDSMPPSPPITKQKNNEKQNQSQLHNTKVGKSPVVTRQGMKRNPQLEEAFIQLLVRCGMPLHIAQSFIRGGNWLKAISSVGEGLSSRYYSMSAFDYVVFRYGVAMAQSLDKVDDTFANALIDQVRREKLFSLPMRTQLANEVLTEVELLGWSETERNLFFASITHETYDLTELSEKMNYSINNLKKKRATEKRWRDFSDQELEAISKDPKAIARVMYGGRMGNNTLDDGYNYRGKSLIHLTGKAMYAKIGDLLGVDLVGNPDILLTDARITTQATITYWEDKKKTSEAFRKAINNGDIDVVSRIVNGGINGLADRRKRYKGYCNGNKDIYQWRNF